MDKNEIYQYTDNYGLVQSETVKDKNVTSQNGIRFTSEWVIVCQQYGLLNYNDIVNFGDIIRKCAVKMGLYNRAPNRFDQEGPDDYVALISAAHKIYPGIVRHIYWHGVEGVKVGPFTVKYVYNNVNPKKFSFSAWLGRQLQFVAHLKWAVGNTPGPLEQLVWFYSVVFGPKKGDQDSWALSWHLLYVAEKKNWFTKLAGYLWRRKFKKYYKTMREALAGYYESGHAITKYWKV